VGGSSTGGAVLVASGMTMVGVMTGGVGGGAVGVGGSSAQEAKKSDSASKLNKVVKIHFLDIGSFLHAFNCHDTKSTGWLPTLNGLCTNAIIDQGEGILKGRCVIRDMGSRVTKL
jgi:hypothetical protein